MLPVISGIYYKSKKICTNLSYLRYYTTISFTILALTFEECLMSFKWFNVMTDLEDKTFLSYQETCCKNNPQFILPK